MIFIIVLLLLAFFVYRLISPTAAKTLLYDLKSFSNTTIGTNFSLNSKSLETTWTVLDITGTIVEETWFFQEITGDEELLLNDMLLTEENFDIQTTTTWTTSPVTPPTTPVTPPTTPPKTTTTSSSSYGLSSQDKLDAESMLGGFEN